MFGLSFDTKNVSVQQAYEKLGTPNHCLLDVRSMDEVRDIGVEGALNIPLDILEAHIDQLTPYTSIHVMCRTGGRSAVATNILQRLGMTHAVNVSGGILAWQEANLPTV
ncbi:rhodanese-like domain-containing protein [Patescibacteria group bacterium]|nr:rhodanese-like domain-containing protein [Patescibacteria group bacterium]MBU1754879.1 rhodanese-like domain-containing protein [Patescibacteria group bacterium]